MHALDLKLVPTSTLRILYIARRSWLGLVWDRHLGTGVVTSLLENLDVFSCTKCLPDVSFASLRRL